MNFELTEDQQAFVDTAKAFADKELAPNAAKWDEEHHFPIEVFRKAGEMGFMGMYTPEEAGGVKTVTPKEERENSTLSYWKVPLVTSGKNGHEKNLQGNDCRS